MKKNFSAQLLSLHPILNWIRTDLKKTRLPKEEMRRIEIAIEEALVNIFSYAYPSEVGTIEVSIHHEEGKSIEITFKDEGPPFNPLEYKKPTPSLARIESLQEGGLGILLMQHLVDKVEYHREKNTNVLSLKKNLLNAERGPPPF